MNEKYQADYATKFNELREQIEALEKVWGTTLLGVDWRPQADRIAHEYARSQETTADNVASQLCVAWKLHQPDAKRMVKDTVRILGQTDECVRNACDAFNAMILQKEGAPPHPYPIKAMQAAILSLLGETNGR